MKTVSQIIKLSCEYLLSKGSRHSRRDVEELIASTLGLKRLDLYLNFDKPLVEHELAKIRQNLQRLATNEPLQYIEGTATFHDCTIKVDKRVLIPRPETEQLASIIIKRLQDQEHAGKALWDICTGSGCLGIAIKKNCPDLRVTVSDVSIDALQVAQENINFNGVDISCFQGDLLSPFEGLQADFVVSNPPYVAEHEFRFLDPNVRDFEPKLALVSGKTGLECYERFAHQLKSFVKPQGIVWFEVGMGQAKRISSLLSSYANVTIIKDFAGIERFIEFQIPS